MNERNEERLDRFERQTAVPMLVLSIAIIPVLVIPLTVDLSDSTYDTIIAIDWILWAVFALEYGTRLMLARDKGRFFRSNLLDLLVVVLPFLRPLRVVRSARALRALRAARASAFLFRGGKAAREVLTRHKLNYALSITIGAVVVGALMVLSFERDVEGATITTVPDALWWAVTTVTTVGYGDKYPITAGGRGIAVVLMVMGIALFGFLAGSLASYFLETDTDSAAEPQPDLAQIDERLRRIETMLQSARDDVFDSGDEPR